MKAEESTLPTQVCKRFIGEDRLEARLSSSRRQELKGAFQGRAPWVQSQGEGNGLACSGNDQYPWSPGFAADGEQLVGDDPREAAGSQADTRLHLPHLEAAPSTCLLTFSAMCDFCHPSNTTRTHLVHSALSTSKFSTVPGATQG